VVVALWDSWDDDAFIRDKESGIFLDPAKMHPLNHKGDWFSVRGPLNVPRTPQGRPVIVQAGGSEDMIRVAAEFAEVIFCAPLNIEQGRTFYAELKARMAEHGRCPDEMKIMPGLSVVVGRTTEEAEEKQRYLNELTHPIVAREILSTVLGNADLSGYPMDEPMPQIMPTKISSQSIITYVMDIARRGNLTLRQTAQVVAGARGKFVMRGTPEHVADVMEEWFRTGACDGFNVMPPYLPGALDDFVTLVIPELQRRGLFRTEYEGRTLRENLGLKRPESRHRKTGSVTSRVAAAE
jgi:N-acetyl-S-(2-succino)cysteine monooxygenase